VVEKTGENSMKVCNSEILQLYLDGQVSAAEAARVEAHLAGCGECRQWLRELQGLKNLVNAFPSAKAPARV
jgi:anti-sigma factor RsiW